MSQKVNRPAGTLAQLLKQVTALTLQTTKWREQLTATRAMRHVGKKEFLTDPACDAPQGTCKACSQFSAANVGLIESLRERGRVTAQISLFSQDLSNRKANNLKKATKVKGNDSRHITVNVALEVFGTRSGRSLHLLVPAIAKKRIPACDERTIRRHLKHPESIAQLERAGKKIV